MTFTQLALVGLVALLGPLLAYPKGWHLPVVLGELVAGIVIGRTGFGLVDAGDPVFSFLADIGFALVMFVAGTHVPLRDPAMRPALRSGAVRAVAVGVVATALAVVVARVSGIPHAPLYAVLMASSSAALVLPVIDGLGLGGPQVLGLLPQVAIADSLCIVALPLAIDPAHALRAAGGAAAVVAAAVVVWLVLRELERSGVRRRVHQVSEDRLFATELRVQLVVLAALAALAVATRVSIMLAGFAFGLAVTAVGEPRRLARQLFALTEGFLSPLFFVWLGAELDLREFGSHPGMVALGIALGVGGCLAHLVGRLLRQPLPLGLLAAAQLGVPVSAATIGTHLGVLRPGEGAALLLGALLTIVASTVSGRIAARKWSGPTVPTGADRHRSSPQPPAAAQVRTKRRPSRRDADRTAPTVRAHQVPGAYGLGRAAADQGRGHAVRVQDGHGSGGGAGAVPCLRQRVTLGAGGFSVTRLGNLRPSDEADGRPAHRPFPQPGRVPPSGHAHRAHAAPVTGRRARPPRPRRAAASPVRRSHGH